jgi:hypothetical protein
MAQIFHPSMNALARSSIFGGLVVLVALGFVGAEIDRSPYITEATVARPQPVPFSHEHHVRGLGIDCRFCHTSVESSPFAGLPPTKTCMTCHSKVWTDAAMLQPVRASWESNRPIAWTRVHNLPDFVYFDHSIHVNKGVGCSTCHGQVDRMPLTWQHAPLTMEWCLNCHRNPGANLRPLSQIFNMDYQPPGDQDALGRKLVAQYHVPTDGRLINCYTCHR